MRLIWAAAPRWTTAWAVLLAFQGLLPAALVYLTKLLVDSLSLALTSGGQWERARPAITLAAITAVVALLSEVIQSVIDWIRAAQSELVQDHIKRLIHKQAVALDMSFYESADYHDRLDRARGDAATRPLALLESSGSFIQNAITLLAIGFVLIPYSLWLPVILLLSTLPAFYVVLRFDRRYH